MELDRTDPAVCFKHKGGTLPGLPWIGKNEDSIPFQNGRLVDDLSLLWSLFRLILCSSPVLVYFISLFNVSADNALSNRHAIIPLHYQACGFIQLFIH